MTELTVNLGSPVPVYEQIRSQVAALVAVGSLAPGDRLPASRDLAHDLGIAVGTVQRAYRELEAGGVVVSRRRTGTVVAPLQSDRSPVPQGTAAVMSDDGASRRTLTEQARALVGAARAAGLSDQALLDLVRGVQATSPAEVGTTRSSRRA